MEIFASNRNTKKRPINKGVFTLIILLLIFVVGYFLYENILAKEELADDNEYNSKNIVAEAEEEIVEIIPKSEFRVIDGESTYIAYDENAKEDTKFPVVIYSHGSTYTVSEDENNILTKDLDYYADLFVKNGYIFAASNQHGDNWGSNIAIEDTKKLVEFLNSNYNTNDEVYLLGFSMGGLVTMNYAEKYPENVKKIALLAPTSYANTWNSTRVGNIKEIPIKIWHGDRDVNVPYSMSISFINRLKSLGKEVELITVEGVGHFDVDTEFTDAIVEFYKSL